jgi:membrane fusion protein (multidrug efflux system)
MSESESRPLVAHASEQAVTGAEKGALVAEPIPMPPPVVRHKSHRGAWIAGALVVVIGVVIWIVLGMGTVSTDDAYVNGHATFVAPRVSGQVARVLVDDNDRVRKGDLLVQLDREPYEVALKVAEATVASAQSDVVAAISQGRGVEANMRSLRFGLDRAIEDVHNQVALLRAKVATLDSQKAVRDKAQADFDRVVPLMSTGAITKEEYEHRREEALVEEAKYRETLEAVYSARVALGLPPQVEGSADLAQTPPDLDQTFSLVRGAQASLAQAAAQIGYSDSFLVTPRQMVIDFYKLDPSGDVDKIYEQLLKASPAVKQAQAKLAKAQADLATAQLDLRYCDVRAEIDGVVTRRNVNPGDNVIVGQSVMAVRSITEVWIDANFKETQLADLRIGQPVDLDVDMYGSRKRFEGRIQGFTMGTGSTLALLPAQNATGNFVKVVQRLPVRIELTDYDADKTPLFVGLSVDVAVHTKAEPTGPNAGKVLRPEEPVAAPTTAESAGISAPAPASPPATSPTSETHP